MFNKTIEDVFLSVKSSENGLSEQEALIRQQQQGKNVLQEKKKKSLFVKFLEQFKDVLILILLVSCLISVVIAIVEKSASELLDAGIIMFVVLLNAIIGLVQENNAEKTMENLKKITKPYAKVLRDGKIQKIKTEDLVVGDVVILEAGDIVPADLRLFECASLKIEESMLTGESVPVEKNINLITENVVPLGDQLNMAFMGSTVTYGRAHGVVVRIGMNTEMGKIAGALESEKEEQTPITKRLNKTSKIISVLVIAICIMIFIIDIVNGTPVVESFMTAIAIAVCAIPEGLPTAVTITMSIGVKKMSQEKAIVRKLPAVETLGSTQIICSDKTGTLTLNKMVVKKVFTLGMDISKQENLSHEKLKTELTKNKSFEKLMQAMLLCNDTVSKINNGKLECVGDPTETALVYYGNEIGFSKIDFDKKFKRVNEIPFDSERKVMTTVNNIDKKNVAFVKGAVDKLLYKCTHILDNGKVRELEIKDRKLIEDVNHEMALSALRVLGYAYKVVKDPKNIDVKSTENDLIFVGLTGMIDPPRKEVISAIKTCKEAGITPIMITGDHRDTAFAIAKELGIAEDEFQVITGAELDEISDEDFATKVSEYRVYARVNPEHKVKIVKAFKAQNKVVAMTGDGVNDAPSIKSADIGVGMGITGTDVTKSVADVVLTDDNFATIVTAVKEGRRIYSNVLKIVQYLLGTAVSELILLTTIMAIMGRPFFNAALILWVNFVSDTFTALALGCEKAEKDVLKRPPNDNRGHLFRGTVGFNIIFNGIMQSLLVFAVYFLGLYSFKFSYDVVVTMCFVTLVTIQLFHTYNMRSEDKSIFKIGVFSNKWVNFAFIVDFILTSIIVLLPITVLHEAFGITDLNAVQWLICLGFAFLIVPIMEITKIFIRKYLKKKKNTTK